ncbi:XdhC family protein [Litorilinea aerophila]|uniref:XdhC family protein n=1 Tax=Litorilinea aerophila TaxID=1204385 RepID=A0A540VKE1_9CHLR|nr:XdhC family protein [Litorilinea aerophila]MCC9075282.1 XdhC family protein [Litorilinea aerophila]OUC06023.1 sulfurylase small subunit, molybdopterin cytosine dinucleotide biosynthesis [Litorilinea aerophila]
MASATIYQHLQQLLDQGLTVAVATITDVKGSVPREVGAKMIIHPYGQHVGTIGGGCGEADVIRVGLDVIQDGQPRNVQVDLTEEISMNSLGVCGGIMNVFVEPWRPQTGDVSTTEAAPSAAN